jgi:hypothetical protein
MPSGLYRRSDERGDVASEQFRCAPGPMGWRYFSTVQDDRGTTNVDLSVDSQWRPVRIRIQTPTHHLLLSARGSMLDDAQIDVLLDGVAVDFPSPCFPLTTARRLSGSGETEVLAIDGETLQVSRQTHRYEAGDEEDVSTPVGRFRARAWRHVAPRPHFSRGLWIAGDVVVSGDGIELSAYDPGGHGPQQLP